MNLYYLFRASFEKSIKEFTRYKFNSISYFLIFYALFMSMFLGLSFFGSSMGVAQINLGDTLEGLVGGFFLWMVMMMTYSETAYNITRDATSGTLEQVSMADLSLEAVLVMRSFTNLIVNLILCITTLFFIMLSTGYWLQIDVISLLISIFIGIFSIFGISLICGGLALIYKKIQSLLSLVQYLLIALVIPGVDSVEPIISFFMPFRPTIEKVTRVMRYGESFTDFSVIDVLRMFGNSVLYFTIGVIVFRTCTRVAKRRGLLGQY